MKPGRWICDRCDWQGAPTGTPDECDFPACDCGALARVRWQDTRRAPTALESLAWKIAKRNAPDAPRGELVRVESWRWRVIRDDDGVTLDGPTFLICDRERQWWTRLTRLWALAGHRWKWAFFDCAAPADAEPDAVVERLDAMRTVTAQHFAEVKAARGTGRLRAVAPPPAPAWPWPRTEEGGER